jgi:hypothetical protein
MTGGHGFVAVTPAIGVRPNSLLRTDAGTSVREGLACWYGVAQLAVGDIVLAIGSPLDLGGTVTG